MGTAAHREYAGHDPVTVAIVTVSDSRTPETDTNRQYIEKRMAELGHKVAAYRLIKDEPDQVQAALDELVGAAGGADRPVQRRHGHQPARHDLRRDQPDAGKDAARLRRTVPHVQLSGSRRGGDAQPGDGGRLQKDAGLFDAGQPERRSGRAGEADSAGDQSSGLGSRAESDPHGRMSGDHADGDRGVCVGGFLGLRAVVWRQDYQVAAMIQSGLLVSVVVGGALGVAYVVMGSLLWRLLNVDWLSLQFGAVRRRADLRRLQRDRAADALQRQRGTDAGGRCKAGSTGW